MTLKTRVGVAAATVACGALLVSLMAAPVWAQVRAALVKDADNPARQPFAARTAPEFQAGSLIVTGVLLTVPAGKRAVIEHFSCVNYLDPANNFVRIELASTLGGQVIRHSFVSTNTGQSYSPAADVWAFSQPVRAYGDALTGITFSGFRRLSAGLGGMDCTVSGHYVDLAF